MAKAKRADHMHYPSFGVELTNEGMARLTERERVGMWASSVLEAYLNGTLHRMSGRANRIETPYETKVQVWDLTSGICCYCGKEMHPFREFTIDHFVPLANGGVGRHPNLVPCCVSCNNAKSDKDPANFFAGRGPELTWMADAAVAYYRAVLELERQNLATFKHPPLWITAQLVIPPAMTVGRPSKRRTVDILPPASAFPDGVASRGE